MKRMLAAAIAAVSLAWALPAAAQSRVEVQEPGENLIEVGVSAGFPTGLSAKYWLDGRRALGAGLAWNPSADGLMINGDYLMHTRQSMIESDAMHVPVYAGVGGRIAQYGNDEGAVVGPRVPVGVTAVMEELPFSVFAEIAPVLEFGRGDPDVTADAAVGARLVF